MKNTRNVVITGASSGAGRATAVEFAANGDTLILASRNANALAEVELECTQLGARVKCVVTDTSDYRSVINLANEAVDFAGSIAIWINNAGVLAVGEFDKMPMEVCEQVVRTNLLGYMNGTHAVLPFFKKQGYGTVINNISIGGFLPVPFGASYAASKFGLRGFSQALKAELKAFPNIHICDAFPAFLDTPGIQHAANYTGKALRPAPPVYDPTRIAQAILKLSKRPKPATMIGSLSLLLRYSQALMPSITSGATAMVIKKYLNRAEKIEITNGNIFNSVAFGNAVHGGWGVPGKPRVYRKYIGVAIAIFAVGMSVLLTARKN